MSLPPTIVNLKMNQTGESAQGAPIEPHALWQATVSGPLRPKRRHRAPEPTEEHPAPLPEPAPPTRNPIERLKRSGEPQQTWRPPPPAQPGSSQPNPIPSKSLSAQQIVEWLTRSPFALAKVYPSR